MSSNQYLVILTTKLKIASCCRRTLWVKAIQLLAGA